mgnify:FL=1
MVFKTPQRPSLIGLGVFLTALAVSIAMALSTYLQSIASVQAEFEARSDSLAAQISRELEITVATIQSSASALRLNGDTSEEGLREQLYSYLENGDVLASSPAIRNIGLVMNGATVETVQQRPLLPLIGVYPDTDSTFIGADLSFSQERVEAIKYAQDTGGAGVGGRIMLLSGVPGVFFAFPIYAPNVDPTNIEERRAQILGVVAAVLATDSFMASSLNETDLLEIDFEVHDLGPSSDMPLPLGVQTILASSRMEKMNYSDLALDELLITVAPDAVQRDVEVAGHTWRILLAPKSNAATSYALFVACAIAFVGFASSVLAGFVSYQQLTQAAVLKRNVDERTHDLQTANSRITKQANEDELTGLGNRRALADAIQKMIADAPREDLEIAVVHIDLDRFKQINDTMGHAGGDFVLRHVAERITTIFPADAFCARVGGDEFTVALVLDAGQKDALVETTRALVAACSQPVLFEGRPCRFGASVGIASHPVSTADPKHMLVNADVALYRAKEDGRGRVQLFSPEIQAQVIAHKTRSDDILRAIDAGDEFLPFFQPQICFLTGRLYGVEALARWQHPELGILPPIEFLPIAEDLDAVAQIDRMVLERAIEAVNRMDAAGFSIPHLSTNLSFARLMQEDFVSSISNLPPCQSPISFEILESIFLDDEAGPAMWNIDSIRNAGMEVQIDDFGSGRASVLALTRVAPNRMKIDRELVAPIVEHEERLQLVQSIVEIGKVLGIGVTAEGVETQAQAQLLGAMGCDVLQGFLFSPPISERDMFDFLKKEHHPVVFA